MNEPESSEYTLPSAIITRADLARLMREVEDLDNELGAQKARSHTKGEEGTYRLPSVSQGLSDFAELNSVDLVDDQARMGLKKQLKHIKNKAPVMHLTFATEPDFMSLKQLAEYIRKELHPQALLHTGLQPSLVGGVYMRTPNKAYDFSVRAKLAQNRVVIQQDMDQMMHAIPVAEAPLAMPPPQEQAT